MKAIITFIDDTEEVVDNVDREKLKERFETANATDMSFVVTDDVIVQCSHVRCVTFSE